MTDKSDIIGIVRYLQSNYNLWKRDEQFGGGKRAAAEFEAGISEHFPAIAQALEIAVGALEETVDCCESFEHKHCNCLTAVEALSQIKQFPRPLPPKE